MGGAWGVGIVVCGILAEAEWAGGLTLDAALFVQSPDWFALPGLWDDAGDVGGL